MKIRTLDEASAEFDHLHPSTDCVCERIVATEAVHAVNPLRPTLENPGPYTKGFSCGWSCIEHNGVVISDAETINRLNGYLADAEALNYEIEHLRAVAQRAQQREVEAVKRCEVLESALAGSLKDCRWCNGIGIECFTDGSQRPCTHCGPAQSILKGRP